VLGAGIYGLDAGARPAQFAGPVQEASDIAAHLQQTALPEIGAQGAQVLCIEALESDGVVGVYVPLQGLLEEVPVAVFGQLKLRPRIDELAVWATDIGAAVLFQDGGGGGAAAEIAWFHLWWSLAVSRS
jgi:hypothetical protein